MVAILRCCLGLSLGLLALGLGLIQPGSVAALSCGPCPATATADLNLRAGPGTSAEVLRVIPEGAALEWDPFVSPTNAFVAVSYDGTDGWAASAYLLLYPAFATTTADLNLRTAPSLSSTVETVMPAGTNLLVLSGPADGFFRVLWQEEQAGGWASGDFLRIAPHTTPVPGTGSAAATTTVDLNLRSAPSFTADVILVMPAGSRVLLNDAAGDGFISVNFDGTGGWAHLDYLDIDAGSDGGPVVGDPVVVTAALNFRVAPSLSASITNVLPSGTRFEVVGGPRVAEGYTWVQIRNGQYGTGWVAADFLTVA